MTISCAATGCQAFRLLMPGNEGLLRVTGGEHVVAALTQGARAYSLDALLAFDEENRGGRTVDWR